MNTPTMNVPEVPLSYFTDSIIAILNGLKTQSRVPLKVQPEWVESDENSLSASGWHYIDPFGKFELRNFPDDESFITAFLEHDVCPYGKVGDRIWVREEWKAGAWREDGRVAIDYKASPELVKTPWVEADDFEHYCSSWSDELDKSGLAPDENGFYHWEPGKSPLAWNAADTMPQWASRIVLEITNTRLDRLHNISEEDAIAEGVKKIDGIWSFETLWEEIANSSYGKWLGYSPWSSNPWVWVIEFKVVSVAGA